MTSVPTPKPFAFAPLTKEKLDYAPLDSISLAEPQFSSSLAHRKQLAAQVKRAASEHGFFYLTECGFSEAETMEQFAIGREFCDLPVQEKESFKINGPIGNYYGFSPPGIQFTNANSGSTPPLYEMWNTPKFTREFSSFHATYTPPLMQSYRPKIEPFAKRVYETGIKLLRLIALALEIPEEHGGEDFFTKLHAYGNECGFAGDTWRYMLYHKTTDEHDKANDFTRIGGHTDAGTLTLLFSHPIMGLQMQMPDGTYKWVGHVPGAIIFITGGFLKSTVHRVVTPPKDQRHYDRLGLLYFIRPDIHLDLSRTIWRESPVVRKHLEAAGKTAEVLEKEEREQAKKGPIEVGEWINERVKKIFTPVNNYTKDDFELKGIKLVPGGGLQLPVLKSKV